MPDHLSDNNELKMIAHKSFLKRDDMYQIVDFLNKNLKDRNLIFGLQQDDTDKDKMNIRIYEV